MITDDYIERLIDNYIRAAKLAQRVGFHFVDVKHCHGYLGHEMLSARSRARASSAAASRTARASLREIIEGIRAECPGLMIGVRLSAFDHPPFKPDPHAQRAGKLGPGIPEEFAASPPLRLWLRHAIQTIRWRWTWPSRSRSSGCSRELGVRLINISCGSPYYNPHIQRPAIFPPSDGYQPPEDPLVGVARQIDAVRQLKAGVSRHRSSSAPATPTCRNTCRTSRRPSCAKAGPTSSASAGWCSAIWELPADTLAGTADADARRSAARSATARPPRATASISGCYPLDRNYSKLPEAAELKVIKRRA